MRRAEFGAHRLQFGPVGPDTPAEGVPDDVKRAAFARAAALRAARAMAGDATTEQAQPGTLEDESSDARGAPDATS